LSLFPFMYLQRPTQAPLSLAPSSPSPPFRWFATSVKAWGKYDDTLDVFGVHGVGGALGTLALAVFAHPMFGGNQVGEGGVGVEGVETRGTQCKRDSEGSGAGSVCGAPEGTLVTPTSCAGH
jgi:hypothetical protein